ncbi:hypothetical protein GN956_G15543 [Arapaima gigas]
MKNPITVMTAMVSVEFVLYTMCLCTPQWLVQPEGTSEGLFAICNTFQGFSSCTALPAWMGSFSLTWMFLAGSCGLSFLTLFAIRPAILRGGRAVVAVLLNFSSVLSCIGALVSFLVTTKAQVPLALHYLGWSFYICCATLFYASLVSVVLAVVRGSPRVEPADAVGHVFVPQP